MNRVAEIGGRVGLLLILVIASLVAGRPWPASAQDNPPIYVPPDDAGALISAINDANIYPGPDTIILEGEGYELTSPDNFMGIGDNGLPRITSEIVIRGDNAVVARWPDAPDPFRVFYIESSGDLTLEHVTAAFGEAQYGGGIYNAGGTLSLVGSRVVQNRAVESGSGIYNAAGALNLTGSTIEGNAALMEEHGDGVYVYGGSTTSHCTNFEGNGEALVEPVNDPPSAVDDSGSTLEDFPTDVSVLANDSDPEGDALSIDAFADPTHGTVTRNSDDTLKYTPDVNWSGVVAFTYTVCDSGGLCNTATATITVLHPNYVIYMICAADPVPQEGSASYTVAFESNGEVRIEVNNPGTSQNDTLCSGRISAQGAR